MIGNHTKRYVDFFLFTLTAAFLWWQGRTVFFGAQVFEFIKNWTKNVCLVIRDRAEEVGEGFCVLNNRSDSLKTHTRIDVTLRQRRESSVWIGVELDENEIPNLDATGISFIYQCAVWFSISRKSDVNLRARPHR